MKFVGNKVQQIVLLLMSVVERRAHLFTQSVRDEWNRVVTSIVCVILSLVCLAFSGLIATVWLIAFALHSPDRNLILSIALVVPLLVVGGIAIYLKKLWNQKLFMHDTRSQLNEDWGVLHHAVREKQEESATQ